MDVIITMGYVDTRAGCQGGISIETVCKKSCTVIAGDLGKANPYPFITVNFEDLQKAVNDMVEKIKNMGASAICSECGKEK